MLNYLLNSFFAWRVKRAMRSYHAYPADKTAVVFLNVQNAFMKDKPNLVQRLASLAEFAREKKFHVIHAPMSATSEFAFPTPAHVEIERLLTRDLDGPTVVPAVGPQPSDVTLPARSTLSVFGQPKLDELIKTSGLEHLIFAGPLADITVDSSLRDAVQRDCHVTVMSDCISATSESALNLELRHTMPRYAHLITNLKRLKKLSV
jgi:nicotinamidase-related amidase